MSTAIKGWPTAIGAGSSVTDRQYQLLILAGTDGVLNTGNNVVDNPSGGSGGRLAVTAPGGMFVAVAEGYAAVNGALAMNDSVSPVSLAVDPAPGGTDERKDLVVVGYNRTSAAFYLAVNKGTAAPAGTSVLAALTKTANVWEIPLAQVFVAAGTGSITTGMITDMRPWSGPRNRKTSNSETQTSTLTNTGATALPVGASGSPIMQIALSALGNPVEVDARANLAQLSATNINVILTVNVAGPSYPTGQNFVVGQMTGAISNGWQMVGRLLSFDGDSYPILSPGYYLFTLQAHLQSAGSYAAGYRTLVVREIK